ncbi:hypothetical protein COCC4DRAFT_74577 [Bipolaris maydis ATCC 48331]|uniref:Mitochondrial intermembrane space import and assembly protein 40 n=2 Tax=Cochliobolus heterostrophus TaxID=5016 RepID=M2UDJ8_COCH5|nr:uncharacterized protein COCC4DRAFT_74577 [Bipolaris maydis ATCC 48331]EMD85957.1 hypothetical protein COCHEDRAFT_1147628 [Bipolaris maydis C5]KAJ5028257.1 hypothetical protein J3E73DRAFT_299731 [Bipolaris maydis]ENI01960.1 hypothetical protein COCC4DRAFT_74577 [Bipolaris maydis ATCC 48331]KAJ5063038.1 hypothetical protein J3E74DRAFT_326681 [Bipolaris maydis]KAJ6199308.1 hypothetical protein J3E72DRAFT_313567 [Bipolaris maydis]
MFRAAPRLIARPALRTASLRSVAPTKRYISTAPPSQKSRSFKSLVARVGIAGAIIYYYNTTDVFAEEPRQLVQALPETEVESEHLPTIESISEERKRRQAVQAQLEIQKQKEAESAQQNGGEGGIEGLEEEADQQGAFNPETGEINWDCPCLGGMAHGPCGEQFKSAFSCFVYSKEEPKGMDCIDKFKDMQNCFREYPEIYGSELDSDDADDDMSAAPEPAETSSQPSTAFAPQADSAPKLATTEDSGLVKDRSTGERKSKPIAPDAGLVPEEYKSESRHNPVFDARGDMSSVESEKEKSSQKPKDTSDTAKAKKADAQMKKQEPVSESKSLVPKDSHDASEPGTERLSQK